MGTGTEDISAFALIARGDWYLDDEGTIMLRGEYIFGSGDNDRRHATNTVGGNLTGTDDNAFVSFGYLYTGLAQAPRPTNLHILHGGISLSLLRDPLDGGPLEVGVDIFIYQKHKDAGAMDDPFASPFSGVRSFDVGEEIDIYMNWQALSDLGVSIRLGLFNPGHAYSHRDPLRTFLGMGMIYSF